GPQEEDHVGLVVLEPVPDHAIHVRVRIDVERVHARLGVAETEVDEREPRQIVAGDEVARDERAIRTVEDESDSGRQRRGLAPWRRGVRAVVVPELVVRDAVVGRDLRLTAVDHVDDDARRVAGRAVVRHPDVLTVLDLESDLAVGGLVVVDEDILVLPGVEAGVRVGASASAGDTQMPWVCVPDCSSTTGRPGRAAPTRRMPSSVTVTARVSPASWYVPGSTRMVVPAGAASTAVWIDSPEWTTTVPAPAVEARARVRASARVQAVRGMRASCA